VDDLYVKGTVSMAMVCFMPRSVFTFGSYSMFLSVSVSLYLFLFFFFWWFTVTTLGMHLHRSEHVGASVFIELTSWYLP
jgi:hypothetical protein